VEAGAGAADEVEGGVGSGLGVGSEALAEGRGAGWEEGGEGVGRCCEGFGAASACGAGGWLALSGQGSHSAEVSAAAATWAAEVSDLDPKMRW